jgi:hypothetical protein
MKHLILSGGRPWLSDNGGKRWVDALLAYSGKTVHIAYCLFAQDPADWPETLRTNQDLVRQFAGSREVSFKTLEHDSFFDVSAWADVIVIVGGDPAMLRDVLEQYGDLMQLWDGKTISGSSAGADIMVRRYMYLQDKVIQEGFGWVPVHFIPHWQANGWKGWEPKDWAWAANELAGQPGQEPLLCVREGDFVEIAVQ